MKSKKILFISFIGISFTISLDFTPQKCIEDCFSMIWNDRITKRSWIYLEQDETKVYKKNSDISEGDLLKMPKNMWDADYTDNVSAEKFGTPNKTNASFKLVTLGYNVKDQKKTVGFDFMILNQSKKEDDPYIFRIVNNSQKESSTTLGTLREVGFVFDNWAQYWDKDKVWTGGNHSFKANYQVEDLDKIIVKFKFRLVDYNAPLNKEMIEKKWLGSYATCDFRFIEYDENGKPINSYLIGLVFSNPLKVDFNGNPNDGILFGSTKTENGIFQKFLLLHGNKNGVKEVNTIDAQNGFKTVEIDFKPLIEKYFNINKNHKNIISGLDIYSATRATNFTYDIQDVQVNGCKGR